MGLCIFADFYQPSYTFIKPKLTHCMYSKFTKLFFIFLTSFATSFAQISISSTGTAFIQDFNTLVNTGTSSTTPSGWIFLETGTGANTTYAVNDGTVNSGNTYSFGASGSVDRAFGTLLSGSVASTIGASFVNNSGSTITSLDISYTGEQWRVGTLGRVDRLDFQYSVDATSLNTGTYTDVNNLDFIAPTTTGIAGALDGEAAANRTGIAFSITGLNIVPGSTFWIRWTDLNATSADDGLAIDNFSITANGTPVGPCTTPAAQPTSLSFSLITTNSIAGSFATSLADKYLVVISQNLTLSATPVNGISYTAGSSFGGGTISSAGPGLGFTATALTQGTTYYFFVFAYNDVSCSGGPNYLTSSPLTGDATTSIPPPCATPGIATTLVLTPSVTSISGSFTGAASSKYLVIQTSSSPFTGTLTDGTVYSVNSTLGNGKVVSYNGTTNFTATGLTANTTYFFFVYSANDACVGEPFYSSAALSGNTTTTSNNVPAGYYNAANGLTCAPLKTALSNIITTGHTQNNYGSLDDVQMLTTDDRLNDAGTATVVYDMYSDNPTGPDPYTFTFSQFNVGSGSDGEGNGWNKEHSFPNSWFSGTSSTNNFPGADLHHIYPTDMDVNSLRGNFPFGKVATASTTTLNGSKLGTSAISFAGYSGSVFEPIDAYKGDFARATLYMVTRYQSEQLSWENLQATGNVVMDGTTWPSVELDYLTMLVQWHLADPVSAKEIERNNEVFGYQNNRNPFVDHPEYVNLVWQCAGALPVTLTDFTAVKQSASSVLLQWSATNETNFNLFEIERSNDAARYIKIGTVLGQNLANYNFGDVQLPTSATVYYRLKMIDIDGRFTYSKVVLVRLNNDFSNAVVYPNPSAGVLNIRFNVTINSNTQLILTDITGRTVMTSPVKKGSMNLDMNLQHLPSGRYFIKINDDQRVIHQSVVIAK